MGENGDAGDEAEKTITQALATAAQIRTSRASEGTGPILTGPTIPISLVFRRLVTPLPSEGYLEMARKGLLEKTIALSVKEILARRVKRPRTKDSRPSAPSTIDATANS